MNARVVALFAGALVLACSMGCYMVDARRAFVIVGRGEMPSTVAVAVLDSRPGIEDADDFKYVGLVRSLYGIPYPVYTISGTSLADDFRTSLATSLALTGLQVKQVPVRERSKDRAVAALVAANAARGLLVEIREWELDAYFTVGQRYDLVVSVYDETGRLLGEEHVTGAPDYGRVDYATGLEIGYAVAINTALRHERIRQALAPEAQPIERASSPRSAPGPVGGGLGNCTLDQVLTMKNSGLTDAQIRAACD